jgi:thioredoxin reductase (NADPH)
MTQPVVLAVDDDGDVLAALEQALRKRYGADYHILAERSPAAGLQTLERLGQQDVAVAVIIADQWMPQMTGLELLARARQLHPSARRLLLIGVWDRTANQPMSQAMTLGRLDGWVLKPWEPAEEHLYLPVSEQLTDWIRATGQPGFVAIQVVGEQWTPRSHEIRDLLDRNAIPYQFQPHDSQAGQQLLRQAGQDGSRLPVLVLFDGRVLVDPTNAEGAAAIGVATRPEPGRYDLIVVGAGPAGLSAATYGASEGLRTLLLEPEALGGQAGSSSLIRNYLGFPFGVTGRKLAQRASAQAILFGAELVYARAVGLRPAGRDRMVILADGSRAVGRTVLVATGAAYRRLDAPGVDQLLGAGVFYGAAVSEAPAMTGSQVFVVGAGNSAGQAALSFSSHARSVTILCRADTLEKSMSRYLVDKLAGLPNVRAMFRAEVAAVHGDLALEAIDVRDRASGETTRHETGGLYLFIGADAQTAWLPPEIALDERGFVLTGTDMRATGRWTLDRDPYLLETSVAGIFACGDVRFGPVKRCAAAVGEGSMAIALVHQYLRDGATVPAVSTGRSTG